MKKKNVILILSLALAAASSAYGKDRALSTAEPLSVTSGIALGPLGTTSAIYCSEKYRFDRAETVREYYRRLTMCLVDMGPDATSKGVKYTSRNLESVPDATSGSVEGTTEGLSGEEQKAMIEAVQEELMGVVGGAEPNALSEHFMKAQHEAIARERGAEFAAGLSKEELAAETIRELEAARN